MICPCEGGLCCDANRDVVGGFHPHREEGRDGHPRAPEGARRAALHSPGREGEGGGRAGADRAPRDVARHLPPRRRALPDDAGGARGAPPAALRDRPVGRSVPEERHPQGPLGPPLLLPQPGRGRAAVRPLLVRCRRGPGWGGRQPRRHELGGQRRVRGKRAFTLIEITVVLVIIAIGTVLAVPMLEAGFEAREVRRAARQIAATMHYCRGEALGLGEPQELVIDPVGNKIHTTGWARWAVLTDRAVIEDVQGGSPSATDGC